MNLLYLRLLVEMASCISTKRMVSIWLSGFILAAFCRKQGLTDASDNLLRIFTVSTGPFFSSNVLNLLEVMDHINDIAGNSRLFCVDQGPIWP